MQIKPTDPIDIWINKVNFNKEISNIKYSKSDFPTPFYLYRGESKKYPHPVSSKISRINIKNYEKEINHYKKCWSILYHPDQPFDSDINLRFLCFLQHISYPTRLIDVTSNLRAALFFAVREFPEEDGFIYKIFGYDILTIAQDLDFADVRSVFFNDNFPPLSHQLIYNIFPHLFYRDENIYNVNNRRQKGWHIIETLKYRGATEFIIPFRITVDEKKQIIEQLNKENITEDYYFPDIKKFEKVAFL